MKRTTKLLKKEDANEKEKMTLKVMILLVGNSPVHRILLIAN